MAAPLTIDLFCGLGGWTEGLLSEGYRVIGFDIEYRPYPGQLVIQDVLTLDGARFKDAALIVASPPCQEYSYMAMPWSRAKKLAEEYRSGVRDVKKLTALFDACFRIQREASEAAGHKIPMVVENVRGAQKWVGRAKWHYGSYYLWGDVPALMPMTSSGRKVPGFRFDGSGKSFQTASVNETGHKTHGMNWSNRELRGQDFTRIAGQQATKNTGGSWFNVAHNTTSGCGNNPDGRKTQGHVNKRDGYSHTRHLTNQSESDAIKNGGDWFGKNGDYSLMRHMSSRSNARKQASAMIAKIPFVLAQHIAMVYKPQDSHAQTPTR